MSRYASLACMDCHVELWLGKAIFKDNKHIDRFHRGTEKDPPNSQQAALTRALWKMLADHAGHTLRVVIEGTPEYEQLGDLGFIQIGGDEYKDISFDQYLKGWNG